MFLRFFKVICLLHIVQRYSGNSKTSFAGESTEAAVRDAARAFDELCSEPCVQWEWKGDLQWNAYPAAQVALLEKGFATVRAPSCAAPRTFPRLMLSRIVSRFRARANCSADLSLTGLVIKDSVHS